MKGLVVQLLSGQVPRFSGIPEQSLGLGLEPFRILPVKTG